MPARPSFVRTLGACLPLCALLGACGGDDGPAADAPDGGEPGTDGGEPGCTPWVEDSFDTASTRDTPPPGWTLDIGSGYVEALVTDAVPEGAAPPSPPTALVARADFSDANVTTDRAFAYQTTALPRPSVTRVRYALWATSTDLSLDLGCGLLANASAIDDYSSARFNLHTDRDGALSLEVGITHSAALERNLEQGVWYQVELELAVDGELADLQVTATPAGGEPATASIDDIELPANLDELRLRCGMPSVSHSVGTATVVVDDVAVEQCR